MITVRRMIYCTIAVFLVVGVSLYSLSQAGRPKPGPDGKADPTLKSVDGSFNTVTPATMEDMMRAKKHPPKKAYTGPPNVENPSHSGQVGGEDIASATVIASMPFADVASTSGFADDYDESCPFVAGGSPDVVYSYTPASDEKITIELCNSAYDTKVYLYENAETAGSPYACNDDACGPGFAYQSRLECVQLTGGNTYYIVVDGYGGEFGDYDLSIEVCPECQGNDDVASAIDIPGLPYTDAGSTSGCTNDYDEACPFTGSTSPDVVYSYTPVANEAITIDLCNSSYDTKVYVYENAVTAGSPYACDDDACGGPTYQSHISCLSVAAGNTYYIVVDGYGGLNGDYELNVTSCGIVCQGNDDVASATVIPGIPYVDAGSTVACVNNYDETCPYSGSTSPDVVYEYTPAADEIIKVVLCNSSYDTKVYIYENSVTPGSPYACDDDGCGAALGYTSILDCTPVTGGNTYYIVIDGYGGASGDYVLEVDECQCLNDDVGSAVVIGGLPYSFVGTTEDCVDNYDEVCPYSGSTSPDVVFEYTPAADQIINLSLCNPATDYDTKLYLYENSVTPGSPYACNDDFCPGFISEISCLPITGGNTYYIIVDGYAGDYGNYELTVDAVEATITCPDDDTVSTFADLPDCDPGLVTLDDPCGGSTVTCERTSLGGVGCTGSPIDVIYTFTVTDAVGNQSSCDWIVTVAAPDCPTMPVAVGNPGQPVDVVVGSQVTVPVTLNTDGYAVRDLDLLIGFDRTALALLDVQRGEAMDQWEYFTHRLSQPEEGDRPSQIRFTAITNLQNGPAVPPADAYVLNGTIAYLTFAVSSDQANVGQELSVSWQGQDGYDNVVIDKSGTMAFVRENADAQVWLAALPNTIIVPTLRQTNGVIRVAPPANGIGDINQNGSAFEVGDAVLLSRALVYGSSALSSDPPVRAAQIAASDINNDGVMLSVGDLVYLVRILTGEASPSGAAKVSPYVASGSVSQSVAHGTMSVSTSATVELGGGLFVFRTHDNTVGTPSLSAAASGMTLSASVRNGELRVLVSTDPRASRSARLPSGRNELFSVPVEGNGRVELIESQLSDADGGLMSIGSAASVRRPEGYALQQNHPNPFNAGTVIPFEMGDAGDWTVRVYNVAGQMIRSFSGTAGGHGLVNVSWDGTDQNGRPVGSGMYLYRVVAGEFTAARKMILLK